METGTKNGVRCVVLEGSPWWVLDEGEVKPRGYNPDYFARLAELYRAECPREFAARPGAIETSIAEGLVPTHFAKWVARRYADEIVRQIAEQKKAEAQAKEPRRRDADALASRLADHGILDEARAIVGVDRDDSESLHMVGAIHRLAEYAALLGYQHALETSGKALEAIHGTVEAALSELGL